MQSAIQKPRSKLKPQKAKTGGGGKVKQSVITSVPASYGSVVPGVFYKFLPARNADCVRLHARVFIGKVGVHASGATYFNITNQTSTLDVSGQWYFNPCNGVYISFTPFQQIATYFQKYYLYGLKLVLYSKVGSTFAGSITTGSMDDPEYFETSGTANASTNPTKLIVSQMFGAKTTNIWEPVNEIPFKCESKKEFFNRGPDGTGTRFSYSDVSADQRMCYAQCAGLVCDGTTVLADTDLFDVYLEYDVELCRLSSIFTTNPDLSKKPSLASLMKRVSALEDDNKYDLRLKPKSTSKKRDDSFEKL